MGAPCFMLCCSCDSCGGGPSLEGTAFGLGAMLEVTTGGHQRPLHKAISLLFQHFGDQCKHKHEGEEQALEGKE